eukprot:4050905-Pyramimonas_sp.AAC.1
MSVAVVVFRPCGVCPPDRKRRPTTFVTKGGRPQFGGEHKRPGGRVGIPKNNMFQDPPGPRRMLWACQWDHCARSCIIDIPFVMP